MLLSLMLESRLARQAVRRRSDVARGGECTTVYQGETMVQAAIGQKGSSIKADGPNGRRESTSPGMQTVGAR
jgi:hypothetical protein